MKKIWRSKGAGKKGSKKFLFVMLLFFLISAGTSYIYFKPMLSSKSSVATYSSAGRPLEKPKDIKEGHQRLYKSDGEDASTEEASGFNSDPELAAAENSIKKYLEPYNTALLDLYMDSEGIIYLDLGGELKRNFKGDASDELNIIAGLYKSIEEAVPSFRALKILIEGKEAETLGGHIDISMPVGREILGIADDI